MKQLHLRDADVAALARSPVLAGLRMLDLSFNHLTPTSVEHLGASAHLAALAWVRLDGNGCGDLNPLLDEGESVVYGYRANEEAERWAKRFPKAKWLRSQYALADAPHPEAL